MQLFLRSVKVLLIIFFLFSSPEIFAQQDSAVQPQPTAPRDTTKKVRRLRQVPKRAIVDTVRSDSLRIDSLAPLTDTVIIDTLPASIPPLDSIKVKLIAPIGSDSARFVDRFYFQYLKPIRYTVSKRQWHGKEEIFYTVVGLLIFFAVLRNSFRRYISELFQTFFRTTIRQKQIKEQLLQSPLPSLMFNVFFVFSTGIFIALLFRHFNFGDQLSFPLLALYAAATVALIYLGKFLIVKIFGWIFRAAEASQTYTFIVFSANKVIGIVILPLLVIVAFTYGYLYQSALALSLFVVIAIFLYRYFLAFISTSRYLKVSFFHFLLYMLAFEVLPLLLINKLLSMFLNELH